MPKARPGGFDLKDGFGLEAGDGPGWDAARGSLGRWGVVGDEGPDLGFEGAFWGLEMSVEEVERVCLCGRRMSRSLAGIFLSGGGGGGGDVAGNFTLCVCQIEWKPE